MMARKRDTYKARILEVSRVRAQTEVTQAHAINDLVLYVYDASDFNEDGGKLKINDTVYTYSTKDDDASTVQLSQGLSEALAEDEEVYPYPAAFTKEAMTQVDNEDPVLVDIPLALYDALKVGIRDEDEQESVIIGEKKGDLHILEILGEEVVRDGSYLDPETIPIRWEDDDRRVVTSGDVADAVVNLQLSYKPIPEAVFVHVGHAHQKPDTDFTVHRDQWRLEVPLPSYVPVGCDIDVHYAHYEETPPAKTGFTLVGTASSGGHSSFAFPAAAQNGDLFFYSQVGGSGDGAYFTYTDSRGTRIATTTIGGREVGLWVGLITDKNTPLACTVSGGSHSTGQFSHGAMIVLRGTGGKTIDWDPDRVYGPTEQWWGGTGRMPGCPGVGSGAVGIIWANGGIGGAYGQTSAQAPYAAALEVGSYEITNFGLSSEQWVGSGNPGNSDPDDVWRGMAVGLK